MSVPVTLQSLTAFLAKTVLPVMKGLKIELKGDIDDVRREVQALRAELEAIRSQTLVRGVPYDGVFEPGKVYKAGDLTTRRGLWLALQDTVVPPGTDPKAWRLIVKEQAR
jgi:hypothetical protein